MMPPPFPLSHPTTLLSDLTVMTLAFGPVVLLRLRDEILFDILRGLVHLKMQEAVPA